MMLVFQLCASLEVVLWLAGQAFHFLYEFVVTQGQAEVGCIAAAALRGIWPVQD